MNSLPLDDPHQFARLRADTFGFEFYYPRQDGHATYLEVGLLDVRSSDGIRVSYDFQRDGYVIEQPWYEEVEITKLGEKYQCFDMVEHWQEVGFFKSRALSGQNKTDIRV